MVMLASKTPGEYDSLHSIGFFLEEPRAVCSKFVRLCFLRTGAMIHTPTAPLQH